MDGVESGHETGSGPFSRRGEWSWGRNRQSDGEGGNREGGDEVAYLKEGQREWGCYTRWSL